MSPTTPSTHFNNPVLLGGRYRLEKPIGQGGMGIVYRAFDQLTGQTVALKQVILFTQPNNLKTVVDTEFDLPLSLAREFQHLASLRHPHIITVLDYGFDIGHQPYFTMEWLANAQDFLQAVRPLPMEVQLEKVVQMLQALIYLHRRGIVHRDLKPANVLVDGGGQLKVLDFGLSVSAGTAVQFGGTFAYVAPELLQGQPPTPVSDLYAVGMILYELWAGGQHPLTALQRHAFLHAILQGNSPDLTTLGLGQPWPADLLQKLVAKLLARNPSERYQDATAIIADLCNATGQPFQAETVATRESFLQAAPFIGREKELELLWLGWHRASTGRGNVWLIGGESGVGKSRLVEELRIRALVRGAWVLRGQNLQDGGELYGMWQPIIRRLALAVLLSDLEVGVLQAIVPDLAGMLERDIPTPPMFDPQASQARLFQLVADLLRRVATTQPLLLLLEDLQWAGAESMGLWSSLSKVVPTLPVMLVGNYREDERPDLPAFTPSANLLTLHRLSRPQIAQLSTTMLGLIGQENRVINFLEQETEGNVFFLIEVVRALAEEAGDLQRIAMSTLPPTIFPGGIQRVIQRRLEQVAEVDRPLLEVAAIIGRALDLPVLAATLNVPHPVVEVERWLTRCVNSSLLHVQDERWQFAHDKLRETVLGQMPAHRRQQLHQQAAAAIEKSYPQRQMENAGIIAAHLEQADDIPHAIHWYKKAVQYAGSVYAMETVSQHLTKILHYLPPTREHLPSRIELQKSLGGACFWMAQLPKALVAYQEMRHLAESLGDLEQQATAWLRLNEYHRRQNDFKQQLIACRRAEQLAREANLLPIQVTSLLQMGGVFARLGQWEDAQTVIVQVLPLLDRLPLNKQPFAHKSLARIYRLWGEMEAAQQNEQLAQNLFLVVGEELEAGIMWAERAHTAYLACDYDLALTLLDKSHAFFTQVGYQEGVIYNELLQGGVYYRQGRYDLAEKVIQQVRQATGEEIYAGHAVLALRLLGQFAYEQGDYAEAQQWIEQSAEMARRLRDENGWVQARCYLAGVLVRLGEVERALGMLLEVLEQMAEWAGEWEHLRVPAFCFLAEAYFAQGDLSAAQTWAHKAVESSQQLHTERAPYQSLAWRTMGQMIRQEMGDEQALNCFSQSLAIATQAKMGGEERLTRLVLSTYQSADGLA